MAVEFTPAHDRVPLSPISWGAIFASLAVGISVMLLLTLAGVAIGVTVIEPGLDSPRAITVGAAIWQTASMLVAALIGGYVAARLSGLRRTGDGVLHGAVSWGATTLLYAALALTALGTLTAGMFGLAGPGTAQPPVGAPLSAAPADPAQAQRTLEDMGLTPEQARKVIDQLGAAGIVGATPGTGVTGAAPLQAAPQPSQQQSAAPPQPQPFAALRITQDGMEALGAATAWLAAAVLFSLLLSLAGGALGVRPARRANRRLEHRSVPTASAEPTPAILSRP
jgi:hypothetical protein